MTGADGGDDSDGQAAAGRRIPGPRAAADDRAFLPPAHAPVPPPPAPPALPHRVLTSLLGAWALAACSAEETAAVEEHLTGCARCADEALRLRDAVGLLHSDGTLDLDPMLRSRVLEGCLGRRPARIPVPDWAAPYDAETARLDALLRDIGDSEWHAPVRLKWFEDDRQVNRKTTVAGVISHLMAVDGLVSRALGLDDPLGGGDRPLSPTERTEAHWSAAQRPPTRTVREPWRDQSHALVRTVSFAGRGVAERSVAYGGFALPLQDSLLERAFECWVHGGDIADAVDYPYDPPAAGHLHRMIDLAARLLPATLAARRLAGLAAPAERLVSAGAPCRSLHLEIEGRGGGDWYIALDSPAALGSPDHTVAQVALDGVEFCRLVAGHVPPVEAAAGQEGDREAIRDVLFAAASLSRL
ncbi:maleylpyruvate isomerase N-terminal domain-containing protein [Streptomyces sp. NBC_01341]|uniref:maleylpyruvate isomerase N-terminal domain-containing protein n=1 Tax=Streptomyces sp. NBC_01341 TaxID=2903831 RepID=UPI002E0EAB1E|nr:maleylpyruvate isomerase N-terminal domain-containing protein [Streptomyces sp. NBC_01341]